MSKRDVQPLSPTLATSFHAYLCKNGGTTTTTPTTLYQDVKRSVDSLPNLDNNLSGPLPYEWHSPLPTSSLPMQHVLPVAPPDPAVSTSWTPTKIFWIFGSFLLGVVLVSRLIDLAIAKYNETTNPGIILSDEEKEKPSTPCGEPRFLPPAPPLPPDESYLAAYMKAPNIVKPVRRRRRKPKPNNKKG